MTVAVAYWPGDLPDRPLARGYTEAPPNPSLAFEPDHGPDLVRGVGTAGIRPISITYQLDGAQSAVLDEFYVTTLKHGRLAFSIPHPRTGQMVTARMTEPSYSSPGGDVFYASLVLRVQV